MEELGLKSKNPEIRKLFSAWCDAETALEEALSKLPRYKTTCDCESETASAVVAMARDFSDDAVARCLDCGGRI